MPARKGKRGYLPPRVRNVYEALRRKRYSKAKSARIAYSVVNGTVNRRRGRKRQ